MDEETVYTDEQIQDIAERIAKSLRETPEFMFNTVFTQWPAFREGPLAVMSYDSKNYNPLGKFPIEADALTTKQKAIVIKIVGKAMSQVGIDRDHSQDSIERCEECRKKITKDGNVIQSFGISYGTSLPPIIYFCSKSCQKEYDKKRAELAKNFEPVKRDWDLEQRIKNLNKHRF